jgi:hypothetical protein
MLGPKQYVLNRAEGGEALYNALSQHIATGNLSRYISSGKVAAGGAQVDIHERAHDIATRYGFETDPMRLPGEVVAGFRQFDIDPSRPDGRSAVLEGFAMWLLCRETDQLQNLTPQQQAANDYAERWLASKEVLTGKLDCIREMFQRLGGNDSMGTGNRFVAWVSSAREVVMRMPRHHKIIWAGIICLGLLALYPPWKRTWSTSGEAPAGYHLIFLPPETRGYGIKIDVARLLIPMALVVCVTAALVVFTIEKSRKQMTESRGGEAGLEGQPALPARARPTIPKTGNALAPDPRWSARFPVSTPPTNEDEACPECGRPLEPNYSMENGGILLSCSGWHDKECPCNYIKPREG